MEVVFLDKQGFTGIEYLSYKFSKKLLKFNSNKKILNYTMYYIQ